MQWIQNAIFTEPDDQSSWLYLRWLLLWARTAVGKVRVRVRVRVKVRVSVRVKVSVSVSVGVRVKVEVVIMVR